MKISKPISTVLFLLILSMSSYAQNNNTCPDNAAHPQNNSEELLTGFLHSDGFESIQPILNLPDLEDEPIELLTGSNNSCYKLNNYISQHTSLGSSEHYTYYKISNYYFIIFWYSVNTTRYRNMLFLMISIIYFMQNYYSLYTPE